MRLWSGGHPCCLGTLSRGFTAFAGGHPNISFFFELAQLYCHHYVGVLYVSGPDWYRIILYLLKLRLFLKSLTTLSCNRPVILNMDDVAWLGVV